MSEYHGWTHAAKADGGTDPIPQKVVGRDVNVTYYELTPWGMQLVKGGFSGGIFGHISGGTGTGFTWVDDLTLPTGGYAEATAIGDYIALGAALGPRGSMWAVGIGYQAHNQGGEITFEWATSPVDSVDSTQVPGWGTTKSIVHHYEFDPTFYNTGTGYVLDTSNAGTVFNYETDYSMLVVSGSDGQMLSQDGVSASTDFPNPPSTYIYSQIKAMRGGGDPSVMWWCRLRVSGNGAVGGTYKARIGYIKVYRVTADDHPVG